MVVSKEDQINLVIHVMHFGMLCLWKSILVLTPNNFSVVES